MRIQELFGDKMPNHYLEHIIEERSLIVTAWYFLPVAPPHGIPIMFLWSHCVHRY